MENQDPYNLEWMLISSVQLSDEGKYDLNKILEILEVCEQRFPDINKSVFLGLFTKKFKYLKIQKHENEEKSFDNEMKKTYKLFTKAITYLSSEEKQSALPLLISFYKKNENNLQDLGEVDGYISQEILNNVGDIYHEKDQKLFSKEILTKEVGENFDSYDKLKNWLKVDKSKQWLYSEKLRRIELQIPGLKSFSENIKADGFVADYSAFSSIEGLIKLIKDSELEENEEFISLNDIFRELKKELDKRAEIYKMIYADYYLANEGKKIDFSKYSDEILQEPVFLDIWQMYFDNRLSVDDDISKIVTDLQELKIEHQTLKFKNKINIEEIIPKFILSYFKFNYGEIANKLDSYLKEGGGVDVYKEILAFIELIKNTFEDDKLGQFNIEDQDGDSSRAKDFKSSILEFLDTSQKIELFNLTSNELKKFKENRGDSNQLYYFRDFLINVGYFSGFDFVEQKELLELYKSIYQGKDSLSHEEIKAVVKEIFSDCLLMRRDFRYEVDKIADWEKLVKDIEEFKTEGEVSSGQNAFKYPIILKIEEFISKLKKFKEKLEIEELRKAQEKSGEFIDELLNKLREALKNENQELYLEIFKELEENIELIKSEQVVSLIEVSKENGFLYKSNTELMALITKLYRQKNIGLENLELACLVDTLNQIDFTEEEKVKSQNLFEEFIGKKKLFEEFIDSERLIPYLQDLNKNQAGHFLRDKLTKEQKEQLLNVYFKNEGRIKSLELLRLLDYFYDSSNSNKLNKKRDDFVRNICKDNLKEYKDLIAELITFGASHVFRWLRKFHGVDSKSFSLSLLKNLLNKGEIELVEAIFSKVISSKGVFRRLNIDSGFLTDLNPESHNRFYEFFLDIYNSDKVSEQGKLKIIKYLLILSSDHQEVLNLVLKNDNLNQELKEKLEMYQDRLQVNGKLLGKSFGVNKYDILRVYDKEENPKGASKGFFSNLTRYNDFINVLGFAERLDVINENIENSEGNHEEVNKFRERILVLGQEYYKGLLVEYSQFVHLSQYLITPNYIDQFIDKGITFLMGSVFSDLIFCLESKSNVLDSYFDFLTKLIRNDSDFKDKVIEKVKAFRKVVEKKIKKDEDLVDIFVSNVNAFLWEVNEDGSSMNKLKLKL